jgi:membrane protease YdiL (CAAX protease family)
METGDATKSLAWRTAPWTLHGNLTVALLAQVGCWYLASPFPHIGPHERTFEFGVRTVLIAATFLLVLPAVWLAASRQSLACLGWVIGNVRLGLMLFVSISSVVTIVIYLGGTDPEIQRVYPWVGDWLAESSTHALYWFPIYALYYLAYESFYRGFLMTGLEKQIGAPLAMWAQVLSSVAIHLGKPPVETLAAIPAAFMFGLVAYYSRSIWYVFGIHFVIGIGNDLFSLYHQGKLG